jgi:hypothetical protein
VMVESRAVTVAVVATAPATTSPVKLRGIDHAADALGPLASPPVIAIANTVRMPPIVVGRSRLTEVIPPVVGLVRRLRSISS